MNDLFEKIYCINLKDRTDRWESCKSQFKKYNFIAERFDGIRYNNKSKNLRSFEYGKIGCWLSFYGAVVEAYNKSNSNVLIFQDDFQIIDPPNQFHFELKKNYNELPDDWDVFYLSAYFIKGYDFDPIENFSENLVTAKTAFNLHSVALSRKGMQKFLTLMPEISCEEDVILLVKEYTSLSWFFVREMQQLCNCYAPKKLLITQSAGYSDISNNYLDISERLMWSYAEYPPLQPNKNLNLKKCLH